jgi:hypothetical protein
MIIELILLKFHSLSGKMSHRDYLKAKEQILFNAIDDIEKELQKNILEAN